MSLVSEGSEALQQWRAGIEREVKDIVKTKLREKMKLFEESWGEFKTKKTCVATNGFVNPVMATDEPFKRTKEINEEEVGETGPNGWIEKHRAHGEGLEEHVGAQDILFLLRTHAVDLQAMAHTIRLQLSLIAPPKRSAETLNATVQSEIGERVDLAISFCQQFLSIVDQFHRSRATTLSQIRKPTYDIPDADQTLYEYDQAISISLTRGFLELQYIFVYLSDLLDKNQDRVFANSSYTKLAWHS